jgi:hypothetical protein
VEASGETVQFSLASGQHWVAVKPGVGATRRKASYFCAASTKKPGKTLFVLSISYCEKSLPINESNFIKHFFSVHPPPSHQQNEMVYDFDIRFSNPS